MAVFEEVALKWGGREYKIAPDSIMRLLAQIEEVVTMADLYRYSTQGRPPLAKLSTAFGMALRHAGAQVSDEEVYAGMFEGGGKDVQMRVFNSVQTLLALMIPPSALAASVEEGAAGKGDGAAVKSGSLQKRTKRR